VTRRLQIKHRQNTTLVNIAKKIIRLIKPYYSTKETAFNYCARKEGILML